MEHDFYPSPVSVDTVKTREVMDSVQSALVLVETFQPNFITKNGEKFIKVLTMVIVVQYFLLGVLTLLYVNDSNFKLGFHKNLNHKIQNLLLDQVNNTNNGSLEGEKLKNTKILVWNLIKFQKFLRGIR